MKLTTLKGSNKKCSRKLNSQKKRCSFFALFISFFLCCVERQNLTCIAQSGIQLWDSMEVQRSLSGLEGDVSKDT